MKKYVLEPTRFGMSDHEKNGAVTLGMCTSYTWRNDPKHVLFTLARYKFCAKMLIGKTCVFEAGCGDGIGAPILLQEVGSYFGVDIEAPFVDQCLEQFETWDNAEFAQMDLLTTHWDGEYDSCISLDVIEHIPVEQERTYLDNACKRLARDGVCIVGTPNVTAAPHASESSKIGHVNLKSHEELRALMLDYFDNVFLFSMNDEVVHTGYSPMAHYLLAIGVGRKGDSD